MLQHGESDALWGLQKTRSSDRKSNKPDKSALAGVFQNRAFELGRVPLTFGLHCIWF
jgi:hypothetical protein